MQRVFVDTSAWYAYVNRRDPDHAAVVRVLRRRDLRLLTSTNAFDETVTLTRRLGHGVSRRVGEVLRDAAAVELIRVSAADEEEAWALHGQRPDEVYSFTDCTSFVLMRRLGIVVAVTLDEDFAREGFTVLP